MNRKRNLIYLGCTLFFALSIIVQQRIINVKRDVKIVSTFTEWQEKGKPVVVQTAKRKDVASYAKVTFWQISSNFFEGHVSKSVRDRLEVGQKMVFKVDNLSFEGVISEIAEDISFDTGMFPVRVKFQEELDIPGWKMAYAHTDTIKNVINVSNDLLEKDGESFFIWKVRDGYAVKQLVIVQQRNGYGAIIARGIKEGDRLVVKGFTQLHEGDKVNVLKEEIEEK